MKKKAKKQRGRWVYRYGRPKNISIKQIKKSDVRVFKKDDFAFIPHGKLLPCKRKRVHNLEGWMLNSTRKRILNCIFEEVLLSIMDNMVETKNTYGLSNGVEMIIGTTKIRSGRIKSYFTFNTQKINNFKVRESERNGFAWKIMPSKAIGIKLKEYNDIRKYRYVPCKQSIGKQLLVRSREKLDLLMWKLAKKGLNLSSIEPPFD